LDKIIGVVQVRREEEGGREGEEEGRKEGGKREGEEEGGKGVVQVRREEEGGRKREGGRLREGKQGNEVLFVRMFPHTSSSSPSLPPSLFLPPSALGGESSLHP